MPEKQENKQKYTTQRISEDVFEKVMERKKNMMDESEERRRTLQNTSFDDILYLILFVSDDKH